MVASGVYANILDYDMSQVEDKKGIEERKIRAITSDQDNRPSTSTAHDDRKVLSETNILSFASIGGRSAKQLLQLQKEDPDTGPILKAKGANNKITSEEMLTLSPAARQYAILWDVLEIRNDLLFKRFVKHKRTGVCTVHSPTQSKKCYLRTMI